MPSFLSSKGFIPSLSKNSGNGLKMNFNPFEGYIVKKNTPWSPMR